MFNLLKGIRFFVSNVFQRIGNTINESPEAKKRSISAPQTPPWQKKKKGYKPQSQHLTHGHKAKGNINTDAATFNHPRRDSDTRH